VFRKNKGEIEGLKGQVNLLWEEVLKLREEAEAQYYTPRKRYMYHIDPSDRPTLRGKIDALAGHLGSRL